jgi:hypothetical protein
MHNDLLIEPLSNFKFTKKINIIYFSRSGDFQGGR